MARGARRAVALDDRELAPGEARGRARPGSRPSPRPRRAAAGCRGAPRCGRGGAAPAPRGSRRCRGRCGARRPRRGAAPRKNACQLPWLGRMPAWSMSGVVISTAGGSLAQAPALGGRRVAVVDRDRGRAVAARARAPSAAARSRCCWSCSRARSGNRKSAWEPGSRERARQRRHLVDEGLPARGARSRARRRAPPRGDRGRAPGARRDVDAAAARRAAQRAAQAGDARVGELRARAAAARAWCATSRAGRAPPRISRSSSSMPGTSAPPRAAPAHASAAARGPARARLDAQGGPAEAGGLGEPQHIPRARARRTLASTRSRAAGACSPRRMRLSLQAQYAVCGVFDLAYNGGDEPVQVRVIGERQRIPSRYLEQIFQRLRRAKLVAGQARARRRLHPRAAGRGDHAARRDRGGGGPPRPARGARASPETRRRAPASCGRGSRRASARPSAASTSGRSAARRRGARCRARSPRARCTTSERFPLRFGAACVRIARPFRRLRAPRGAAPGSHRRTPVGQPPERTGHRRPDASAPRGAEPAPERDVRARPEGVRRAAGGVLRAAGRRRRGALPRGAPLPQRHEPTPPPRPVQLPARRAPRLPHARDRLPARGARGRAPRACA